MPKPSKPMGATILSHDREHGRETGIDPESEKNMKPRDGRV